LECLQRRPVSRYRKTEVTTLNQESITAKNIAAADFNYPVLERSSGRVWE